MVKPVLCGHVGRSAPGSNPGGDSFFLFSFEFPPTLLFSLPTIIIIAFLLGRAIFIILKGIGAMFYTPPKDYSGGA